MTVTKAYYLKVNELKILLALKGMKELFGFTLSGEEMNREQVNRALFEMHKKDLVASDGTRLKLIPEMDDILQQICNAGKILLFSEQEGKYPQQCIYLAESAVSLQIVGENRENVRLEKISKENLPEWLTLAGGQLEQLVGDESLYCAKPVEETRWQLLGKQLFEEDMSAVFEHDPVKACFDLLSVVTKKRVERIFLVRDNVQDYIVTGNGLQSSVYEYSKKKLVQELTRCIEGV